MEKSIEITPPEGYEIDKEKSSFEKIVFKKKSEGIEVSNKHVSGYYYGVGHDDIRESSLYCLADPSLTKFYSASEKVARSNIAKNRISHILKYDERFGGEITDSEWENERKTKYAIIRLENKISTSCNTSTYRYLVFHTEKQRDLFLKEYEDLIKDYFML